MHDFQCALGLRTFGNTGRISRRRASSVDVDDNGGGLHNGVVERGGVVSAKNIVATRWFTGKGSVGVILIKTEYAGYKAYIGAALDVNEDYDAAFIVAWGTKLPRSIAAAYFPKKIKDGVLYDGKIDKRPKSGQDIG